MTSPSHTTRSNASTNLQKPAANVWFQQAVRRLLIGFCLPLWLWTIASAQVPTKRVIVITSYDLNRPAITDLAQVLRSTIRDGWPGRVEFFYEFQENARISNDKYESEMVSYLRRKYEGEKIDLIAALGEPVLRFLLKNEPVLFTDIPKIFYFHDGTENMARSVWPHTTGVWAELGISHTLDIALSLHPNTQTIFVVSGNSAQDRFLKEQAQQQLRGYEGKLEFTYLNDLTLDELKSRLSNLPKNCVVIYLSFLLDNAGHTYSGPEALSIFAPSSSAPVYGIAETYIGSGIVGGSLLNFQALGRRTGELGLRILAGESSEDIAPQTVPNINMFDWRELKRWELSELQLPKGSVVRFKEPTFWDQYKWYVIGLTGAAVIEALLIAWLLFVQTRRRRAELERESFAGLAVSKQQKLNEVVSNVPGIVWESRFEPGTKIRRTTFISGYIERMLGYTVEEWLASPEFGLRIMPEEQDRERAIRETNEVLERGRDGVIQFRWKAKDGRIVWTESHLSPIVEEGNIVGLRGVTLDISERKSVEEALTRSQSQLSGIVDSAMDGIITVDETQHIVLFNTSAEMMFGCLSTEAVGQPLDRFIPERFREAHREHIRLFGETNLTRRSMGVPGELYGLRDTGEEFPIEASISQIRLNGQKFYTVILRDITESKNALDQLRHSEELFAKAFRANPQPMSLTTLAGGLYLAVNKSFLSMSGYTREEVIGHTSYELKVWETPETREAVMEQLKRYGSLVNFETKFRTKGGSFRVLLSSVELLDIDGEQCLIVASSDITERKVLEESLHTALEEVDNFKNQLEAENIYLQQELQLNQAFGEIVGQSDAIRYVHSKITQVAPTDSTVLITGETGTGKELIARAIHGRSSRKDRPLIKINCSALSPNLIENELFGHEKGAFTGAGARKLGRFELADHGTMFLDEIGELPLELQSKLLRVIQEEEFERLGGTKTVKVDVRIIAATNRNLKLEVEKGLFREDLWYRLNVFPITAPPLRQRKEDIPLLVEYFVSKSSKRLGKTITSVSPRTMQSLQAYSWPGNVRELANVIERAVIHTQGDVLQLVDRFDQTTEDAASSVKSLEELEREHIIRILDNSGWRIEGPYGAAKILGLHPSTLRARLAKLGIQRPHSTSTSVSEGPTRRV